MSALRRRNVVVVAIILGLTTLAVLGLWTPSDATICAHTLALVPRDHPRPPSEGDCVQILAGQSQRDWPWQNAWRRRCYASAGSAEELHDCGGELAHLPE